ncbi:oligosaccharide flippase family protein [Pseudarthrobacter sp. NamB4]|uniref:oligosaccharide flippase family protein n=1 Tax=Pseudarthrobacter sp. NamB4 TaxID=2576837 RepID=UPI001485A76E|nr:oligosaccharide flippase family protein [Pseudarthrobacter sp. NamB4]
MLYVIGWSSQLVVAALVSPVLAHMLPPAEFGALALGITLHQIVLVFALLGLDQAIVLQRASDGNAHAARGLIAVSIMVAGLVTLLFCVTSPVWRSAVGFAEHAELVYMVILWTAPAVSVQVMLALLLTEDRLLQFALVVGLSTAGGQILGLILLVAVHKDATTYFMGAAVCQFAAMLLAVVFTRPRIGGLVSWSVTKHAVRLGLPLTAASIALFQLSSGDRFIIQVLLGTEEVGRYQAANIMGSIVILLLSFVSGAWTPRFAAVRDETERWALATDSRDELYRILLPVTVGMTLATPLTLQVILPESFRPDSLAIVVFLISLSAFPVAAGDATGRLLIIQRRGKTIGILTSVSAVASVILNIILVPMWGIVGAAVATLATYALLAGMQQRALPASPVWQKVPGRLASAVLVVISASAASILLPQTLEWNLLRFAAALMCLPWLMVALRRARGAVQEARTG